MFRGRGLDAHYLGYVDCFHRQLFYEAHDVLEELWLADRRGPDGDFYKGLIQLAGAFVHLQKARLGPAVALLNLSQGYLKKYPVVHHQLDLAAVFRVIAHWRERIESGQAEAELRTRPPRLELLAA